MISEKWEQDLNLLLEWSKPFVSRGQNQHDWFTTLPSTLRLNLGSKQSRNQIKYIGKKFAKKSDFLIKRLSTAEIPKNFLEYYLNGYLKML